MKAEIFLHRCTLFNFLVCSFSFVVNKASNNIKGGIYNRNAIVLRRISTKDDLYKESSSAEKSNDELSDLDAKVLQSLLAENLDLATEERYETVIKRSNDAKLRREREEQDKGYRERAEAFAEEEFSSTVFKTAMNWDNIFGSLQAKAEEVFESVKIAVTNRIERDLKLSISLGLFALDRAVKDSGRTLGAAKERTVFLLSEESSFEDLKPNITAPNDLFEGLNFNTPLNEIKEVTDEVKRIIGGADKNIGTERSRVLKSFAPMGTSRNADRLRKAYERRKETVFRREKEGITSKVGRTANSLTNAAWEMKSEMSSEVNKPGYRSENFRQAVEETATAMLGAGKTFRDLLPSKKDVTRPLLQSSNDAVNVMFIEDIITSEDNIELDDTNYFDEFLKERARYAVALRLCLDVPEDTWLSDDVMDKFKSINEEALSSVITAMVFARDDFESEINESVDMSFYYVIQEFEKVEKTLDDLYNMAGAAVGSSSADWLKREILEDSLWSSKSMVSHKNEQEAARCQKFAENVTRNKVEPAQEKKSKVRIDLSGSEDIYASYYRSRPQQSNAQDTESINNLSNEEILASTLDTRKEREKLSQPVVNEAFSIDAEIVDDSGINTREYERTSRSAPIDVSDNNVEVIVNESCEEFFIDAKAVSSVDERVSDKEKSTPATVTFTLRALDVILFVLEKTIVSIPRIVTAGKLVVVELNKINRDEEEVSQGWTLLDSLQSGKDRY